MGRGGSPVWFGGALAVGRNGLVSLAWERWRSYAGAGPVQGVVRVAARTRSLLAWSLWLATLACCAGGLVAALVWVRPLTAGLLAGVAGTALAYPLGYATVGLAAAGQPDRLAI